MRQGGDGEGVKKKVQEREREREREKVMKRKKKEERDMEMCGHWLSEEKRVKRATFLKKGQVISENRRLCLERS